MDPTKLRIGIGHDTHRLQAGGDLILGGVPVPHTHSLVGHSDADVLLHAITDAILGAASLGDIGELFPNTSDENKHRDSADMLAIAAEQVRATGFEIINIDCILSAEFPKLSPFKLAIAARIATILGVEENRIGVKAKTGERVGPVGNHEAMQAQAVALLVQTTSDTDG